MYNSSYEETAETLAQHYGEPQPGECYCHLLKSQKLCRVCEEEYVQWNVEEVYGHHCTAFMETKFELGPLEVAALKGVA